ncbi:MAG: hypothetical protein GF329_13830 [Candidatus Lokiarchaeota archaeon]|nr:hypothetical protein [Candidatus Lokiarchaeota archaeon]
MEMINIQSLNGKWKIKPDPYGDGDEEEWWWTGHSDREWTEIDIPSHWQEESLPDYEGIVWYRVLFDIQDDFKEELGPRILLRLNGIFYYTEIWLNNEYLGEHDGYFDTFEFDITNLLDERNNLLSLKVSCYDEKNINKKSQMTGVFSHWDASDPNFNPGGIWGDVELVKKGPLYIKDLSINTKIIDEDSRTGKLDLLFNINSLITDETDIDIKIEPRNFEGNSRNKNLKVDLKPGDNLIKEEIIIQNSRFWWTHDHGFPHLYDLRITTNMKGKKLDAIRTFFGIKELELKKRGGWQFYLNKKRIFIKGSNYAPQNHRIAFAVKEDYEEEVDMMVEANFNMIRIHAHIDKKDLHEITSEKGILVWQDLPLQWYYKKSILDSALNQTEKAVKQLKNYPSQGVWCCHNEPFKFPTKEENYKIIGALIGSIIMVLGLGFLFSYINLFNVSLSYVISALIGVGMFFLISIVLELVPTALLIYNWNKNVLDKKLKKLILTLDPDHPVVKASGLPGKTDFHWYDGWYFNAGKYWKAKKFSNRLLKKLVPFITEYGAQSFPKIKNFKKFGIEIAWPFSQDTWEELKENFRCQPKIFQKIFKIENYESLKEFIDATQEYQAKALKYHNELWRRMRYNNTGGAICFLFNDCAPIISWSIIDFWGTPKKAFDEVKLSFEPLYSFLKIWPRKYKKKSLFKNTLLLVNDDLTDHNDIRIGFMIIKQNKKIFQKQYIKNIGPDELIEIEDIQIQLEEVGDYRIEINLKHDERVIKNKYEFQIS